MARDWKTTYTASAAAAQHTATFPAAATAGRVMVAIGAAPATVAPPNTWNELTDPLASAGELSASVLTAAGGEASIVWGRDPSTSTAPRSLAGWVESRDDLSGVVHGTPFGAGDVDTGASGQITTLSIATTIDGCRIYAAVSSARSDGPATLTPTWNGPVTVDDTIAAPGLGNEPVRLSVASGVVAAGTHPITITGLPANLKTCVVLFAMAPVAGDPPPAAETAVEAENRLGGTAKATWDVTGAGDASIQGFATAMSVARGGTLQLKVHSAAAAWTGRVYRLGYYGGQGARDVGGVAGAQTTQPNGTTDATTGMVSCANWSVNGSWTVPADATPGVYVIKIQRADNAALNSHIGPFVVTDPARKAAIAVKLSDSTWQAYNWAGADPAAPFDGKSIYGVGTASAWTWSQPNRTRAVSYDRPLVTRRHIPQTTFWNAEYPLVRWLERLGYDVDYLTCAQVDADPTLLLGRKVIISSGHDEYWSAGMRDAFVGARDHATQASHALYLSGNEAFWRIRWDGGRRTYACWKDSHDGALNASGAYSGTWQDTRGFNPDRRPAALLNGQRFRLNGISALAMAAGSAHASSPLWRTTAVAGLTGAQTWASPAGIVGFEADEPADMNPAETPAGLLRLSQVTHQVTDLLSDDDGNTYTGDGLYTHAITAYRAATGAVVVAAGTVQFAWGLDDAHDRHPGGTLVTPVLQQALTNLLADLGTLPPAYPFPDELTMPVPVALAAYGFPDTTAPSAPTGLDAAAGQTQINLTWTAAADDVAVTGYDVYRNGALVAVGITATSYTHTGLTAGTNYTLGVRAKDAAGNVSPLATITAATTSAGDTIPGAYATITQLHDHLGRTPANARTLLIRASRAVDRALLCAIYDPASAVVQAALRDAVLEQIAGQLEGGDQSGLGVASAPSSFTIGRLSVQRSSASASAPTTGGLVDQAYAILQAAGLTGHGPAVIG
ncbi:fibronectin type III domain-containing protein [Actinoplanes sp. NPDC048796]|uniref:N,N-dimethylformamidase beta subunit family domain-containing protein n=1 Tax=Actinoplanes sp. NPDC048796 TaxID=3155640 RepID=UPI0033F76092